MRAGSPASVVAQTSKTTREHQRKVAAQRRVPGESHQDDLADLDLEPPMRSIDGVSADHIRQHGEIDRQIMPRLAVIPGTLAEGVRIEKPSRTFPGWSAGR